MQRFLVTITVLLLPVAVQADGRQRAPRAGDESEIRNDKEWLQQTNAGSQGSSTDVDVLIERVIAVSDGGLELEYDLPKDATADDRARTWQFPVRVFKPASGPLQLLNGSVLAARVDAWLKGAKLTRTVCGHWFFTWNAFQIECDPQSVLRMLAHYDLRTGGLRAGAPYREAGAREPVLLEKTNGSDGATFVAEAVLDPEKARQDRAQSDLVIAEVSGTVLTLDAALRARSDEQISGMITTIFNVDAAGEVRRRTTVTKLQIKGPKDRLETNTTTETVERRSISHPDTDNDITT